MSTPFLLNENAWFDGLAFLLSIPLYFGLLALIFTHGKVGRWIGMIAASLLALKGLDAPTGNYDLPVSLYFVPALLSWGRLMYGLIVDARKPPLT
jgi:hypothetical protein